MLVQTKENNRPTVVAWPSGEWQESLERAFATAGIPIEKPKNPRSLTCEIPLLNLLAVIARPSDVLDDVQSSGADAGFTGTDVLREGGIPTGRPIPKRKNAPPASLTQLPRVELPLSALDSAAPRPVIYAGLTPNAEREGMNLEEAVATGVLYTSYPQITSS